MATTQINIHLKAGDAEGIRARRLTADKVDFVVINLGADSLFLECREVAQALRAAADLADDMLALIDAETEAENERHQEPPWQNEKDHIDADAAAGKEV